MRKRWGRAAVCGVLGLATVLLTPQCDAYSVQTHEQLIDLTWKASIAPLLLARFPNMTGAQLQEAHAYAYGGCAIQDIGYYPFGNAFFSDLTHYVRAGDFVASLLRNAKTPDELAFAVGALSHYVGDSTGHSEAVNPSVPVEFPKLRRRYGPIVTYEESPHAHVRTEFAFDINEISKKRFAPSRYLEHVGLKVPTDLLARAFYETYGLRLDKALRVERTTIFGYRFSVRHFLPRIAYAERVLHGGGFPADTPGPELTKLEVDLARADAENGWEAYRRRAGVGTYALAGLIFVLPKVGPLAMLSIEGPTVDTEQRYVKSVNRSTEILREMLLRLRVPAAGSVLAAGVRQTEIPNRDLDTGAPVRPGSYRLTDETYAKLLGTITKDRTRKVPVGLEEDIAAYYSDPAAPIVTKKNPEKWAAVQTELTVLQSMATVPEP
jgi:hypothetical protein